MTARSGRRFLGRRSVQVAFAALLLVCIVQTLWWLLDQAQFTEQVRDRLTTMYDRDAQAALRLRAAGTPPTEIAALYPHLEIEASDGAFAIRPAYRARLADERHRRLRRYGWEGAFFVAVLASGMWVIGLVLRQRRQLAARQQNFVAAVTHELKNPLASLKLSAETLELRAVDEVRRKQLSARMLQEVDRLEAMVTNLLGVARLDAGQVHVQRERVPLAALAQDVVRHDVALARAHGIEVTVDVDPRLAADADPRSVRLVLSNLVDNAVKSSTAQGGSRVSVQAAVEGARVRLDVCDDGLGFDPEQGQQLFTRFYRAGEELRRRTRGTGLGLYLVQQLVALDRGRVEAHSDGPGRGARFTVWWPTHAEAEA